jgi:hypothetical protein
MPVQLEWHSTMPILKATYSGTLSANEYYALNRRRLEMLDAREGAAILLVDLQQIGGFPDAASVRRGDSALRDDRIRRVLAVLPDDLYRRVGRTVSYHSALRVYYYPSMDAALDAAENLLAS